MLTKFWTGSAVIALMITSTMATPSKPSITYLTSGVHAGFEKRNFMHTVIIKREDDEQDGDKVDEGDDDPNDYSEGSAAKRSFYLDEKFATPGSADFSSSSGSIRRRGHGGKHSGKNEKGSHRNEHEAEEKGEGEHGDHPGDDEEGGHGHGREAKRNLKSRRRLLAKRNIDGLITKSEFFVDGVIRKQDKINAKLSGDDGKSNASNSGIAGLNVPNGQSAEAEKAMGRAKALSSSALSGNIKAMENSN
ncbi:hypothetical protein BC941DRAFT_468205 [Chlamydoabsidia padenii]|nr:hypothetical protein BC941DRAFT_468205 [Chlamydoabsidia padenii]